MVAKIPAMPTHFLNVWCFLLYIWSRPAKIKLCDGYLSLYLRQCQLKLATGQLRQPFTVLPVLMCGLALYKVLWHCCDFYFSGYSVCWQKSCRISTWEEQSKGSCCPFPSLRGAQGEPELLCEGIINNYNPRSIPDGNIIVGTWDTATKAIQNWF